MGVKIGSTAITGGYIGSTAIKAIYKGSTLLWQADEGQVALTYVTTSANESVKMCDSTTYISSMSYNGSEIELDSDNCYTFASAGTHHVYATLTDTTFHAGMFFGCTKLTSAVINSSVTEIVGNTAFQGCTALESAEIQSASGVLGNGMFAHCSSLSSVTIPEGITQTQNACFIQCTSLTSISLPSTLSVMNVSSFSGCTSLAEVTINYSGGVIPYTTDLFNNISSDAVLYVPSDLVVSYQANTSWSAAFGGGIQAISIDYFPSSIPSPQETIETISSNVTALTTGQYADRSDIKTVIIEEGDTSVGLSNKTTGYGTFSDCPITHVALFRNATFNTYYPVFGTGGNPSQLDVSNSVKYITIGPNVSTIPNNMFSSPQNSVEAIYCYATTPPTIGTNTFPSLSQADFTIYVPSASVNTYKTAENWSTYADIIQAIS